MTLYVAFGDSIIDFGQIPNTVASLTGMTAVNVGMGGTQFGPSVNSANHDKLAAYSLADAIVSNQWTAPVLAAAALTGDGQSPHATAAVTRIRSVDFSTVDIVSLSWGTNDFGRSLTPMGSNSDTLPTTFKGAINYTLQKLMTAFPLMRILLTTPIWRGRWTGTISDSDTTPNDKGYYLADFADAILEVGARNHVPVADLYRQSGIAKHNSGTLLQPDLIHPSLPAGDRQLGFAFASALLSRFPMPLSVLPDGVSVYMPSPINGWANFVGSEARATCVNGVVMLSGLIKPRGAVPGEAVIVFTLPEGYRPPTNRFFAISTAPGDNSNELLIRSNGSVYLRARLRGSYVSLDGITYRTD